MSFPVVRNEGLSPGAGRNDRFNVAFLEETSPAVGVEALSAMRRSQLTTVPPPS